MPMHEEPVVGVFYEDQGEDGRTFEVTAFDENAGTIEIQYNDGATDEIDLDDWYGMDLAQLAPDEEDDTDEVDDGDAANAASDDTDLDDDDELDEEEEE